MHARVIWLFKVAFMENHPLFDDTKCWTYTQGMYKHKKKIRGLVVAHRSADRKMCLEMPLYGCIFRFVIFACFGFLADQQIYTIETTHEIHPKW